MQILAHVGRVQHDIDTETLQFIGWTDSRQHERLRSAERSGTQDDFLRREYVPELGAAGDPNADRPLTLEQNLQYLAARLNIEVAALALGVQIGVRRT